MGSTEVVVGRIGKAHGIRGEVSVELRTDEPERRFAVGSVLATRTARGTTPHGDDQPASVRVAATRWHQSRLLVGFEGVHDRGAAEGLRGLVLLAQVSSAESPEDPAEFYDHQLVGLAVFTTDGRPVGELREVVHGPGQDLIVVHTPEDREVLVPFVEALIPVVDVRAGRLEVEDVPGLLAPHAEPRDAVGSD